MLQKKFNVFQFGNRIAKQTDPIPTNNILSEFTQDNSPAFNSENMIASKPKEPWECRFEERPPDPRSNPYPCGIPNPEEYICNPCGLRLDDPNRPVSCPSPSNPGGVDPCCSPQFTTIEQKESCCCQKKDPKTWIPVDESCGDCGIKLYPAYPNEMDENGIGSLSDFSGRIGFYAPIRNVIINPNTGQFERDPAGNPISVGQGQLMPKIWYYKAKRCYIQSKDRFPSGEYVLECTNVHFWVEMCCYSTLGDLVGYHLTIKPQKKNKCIGKNVSVNDNRNNINIVLSNGASSDKITFNPISPCTIARKNNKFMMKLNFCGLWAKCKDCLPGSTNPIIELSITFHFKNGRQCTMPFYIGVMETSGWEYDPKSPGGIKFCMRPGTLPSKSPC